MFREKRIAGSYPCRYERSARTFLVVDNLARLSACASEPRSRIEADELHRNSHHCILTGGIHTVRNRVPTLQEDEDAHSIVHSSMAFAWSTNDDHADLALHGVLGIVNHSTDSDTIFSSVCQSIASLGSEMASAAVAKTFTVA